MILIQAFIECLICARAWARMLGLEVNKTLKLCPLKEPFALYEKMIFINQLLLSFPLIPRVMIVTTLKWKI